MNIANTDLLTAPLAELMQQAAALRDAGHGNIQSYSRKFLFHSRIYVATSAIIAPSPNRPAKVSRLF